MSHVRTVQVTSLCGGCVRFIDLRKCQDTTGRLMLLAGLIGTLGLENCRITGDWNPIALNSLT